jgi:hypothetical protein
MTSNPSELARLEEELKENLDTLRDKARREARGPRVPPMSARKRRRRHVREQRRNNR